MRVIIMGCGKVGEQLSHMLENAGHEVTVIDADPAALARLGPEFIGRKIHKFELYQSGWLRCDKSGGIPGYC